MKSQILSAFVIVLLAQSSVAQEEPTSETSLALLSYVFDAIADGYLPNITSEAQYQFRNLPATNIIPAASAVVEDTNDSIQNIAVDLTNVASDVSLYPTTITEIEEFFDGLTILIDELDLIPKLLEALLTILTTAVESINDALATDPDTAQVLIQALIFFPPSLKLAGNQIVGNVTEIVQPVIAPLLEIHSNILSAVSDLQSSSDIPDVLSVLEDASEALSTAISDLSDELTDLPSTVVNIINSVLALSPDIPCVNVLTTYLNDLAANAGASVAACCQTEINTLQTLWNNVGDVIDALTDDQNNNILSTASIEAATSLGFDCGAQITTLRLKTEVCATKTVGDVSVDLCNLLLPVKECLEEDAAQQ